MTDHLFSHFGEFISDEGMRKEQMKYFMERVHPIEPAAPIYMSEMGRTSSATDKAAYIPVADFKPGTDLEHLSMENCIRVNGIFLTSQIVEISGEEAEKLCVRIYREIDEVYDDYSPYMGCRFPNFAMGILYGDSLGKYIQYSEPVYTSDRRAIKLHQLLCLKLRNWLNNLFQDLGIPAEERICGDDGVLGMCRLPGTYNSESGRYGTIFGTHKRTYPIKALCRYLDVDPDLSEKQIDDLIKSERDNPEFLQGIFLQKRKEDDTEMGEFEIIDWMEYSTSDLFIPE